MFRLLTSTEDEAQSAKEFGRKIIGEHATMTFTSGNESEKIVVPDHVLKIIRKVVGIMSEGKAFSLIPIDKERNKLLTFSMFLGPS